MRSKGLLKLVLPIALVVVLAIGLPLTSGCLGGPAAAPPEVAPPEVAPPEVAPPEEVEPIIVGVPIPLSGPASADGIEIQRAQILAFEDINARGGLLGRSLEAITADVVDWTAEPQIAARDYLMGKGVDAFIGGYGLDPCVLGIFAAEYTGGIPYISPSITELFVDLYVQDLDKYWNMPDVCDTAVVYGPHAYEILCKTLPEFYEYPKKTVAILTSEITYNIEISEGFRKWIEEDPEWEVVVDEIHPFGTLDYGVQLAKIRETNPGLIFFSTVIVPESVAFVRQFHENPTDSLLFIQFAPGIPEFGEMLGELSLDILWQAQPAPVPTYEVREYADRWLERWGEEPGGCLAYVMYDEVMLWATAVEAVGDVNDYRAIVDYIKTTPIPGMTWGPGGFYFVPELNIARGPASPYIPERFPGERPGPERIPRPFNQIQMTSAGPQNIRIYIDTLPTWDYMLKYYGYPPQEKYIQELGRAEFEVPFWLK